MIHYALSNSEITRMNISEKFLEATFKDGAHAKLIIDDVLKKFEKDNELYFINNGWDSILSK